jgi:hypothetical protein
MATSLGDTISSATGQLGLDAAQALVHGHAAAASKEVEAARAALDLKERAAAFWLRLAGYLEHGRSAHASVLLRDEFESAGLAGPTCETAELAALRELVDAEAQNTIRFFPRLFEEACELQRVELDPSSRHPHYRVHGFISVDVQDQLLTATVSPRDGAPVTVPADIDPLIEHLKSEVCRIFDRDFDRERFLRSLFNAYLAVLRSDYPDRPRPDVLAGGGPAVPLRRVANRMGKNLARFSLDQFNVDLSKLIQSGQASVDGLRLKTNASRTLRKGMLLYGLESAGYVGSLAFEPAASESHA